MITIPYSTAEYSYTLDDSKKLLFSTENVDTYFFVRIVIKYYPFYENVQQTKILERKVPLFNKAAEYNVGRIIHRVMSNITELNSAELQYKTAMVGFVITEKKIEDDSDLGSSLIQSNFSFIAGILPIVDAKNALLDINNYASRITPNGFKNISFMLPAGDTTLVVYKNNELVEETDFYVTPLENVRTFKYNFSIFNPVPGDVFKVGVKDTTIFKTVYIFPEQTHSNVLLFIDEFKLLQSIECTGEFSLPTSYTQITHKYKRNLVEIIEVIETTKVNSLLINTGWILKTDNSTIDSLMRSKKAWLFVNDNEAIEMVPASKKMVNIDSEEDLYQYNIEFKINRASDAQNYTL